MVRTPGDTPFDSTLRPFWEELCRDIILDYVETRAVWEIATHEPKPYLVMAHLIDTHLTLVSSLFHDNHHLKERDLLYFTRWLLEMTYQYADQVYQEHEAELTVLDRERKLRAGGARAYHAIADTIVEGREGLVSALAPHLFEQSYTALQRIVTWCRRVRSPLTQALLVALFAYDHELRLTELLDSDTDIAMDVHIGPHMVNLAFPLDSVQFAIAIEHAASGSAGNQPVRLSVVDDWFVVHVADHDVTSNVETCIQDILTIIDAQAAAEDE